MNDQGTTKLEISSIFGARTRQGLVQFTYGDKLDILLDVRKAKTVHRMLGEAIEAAISDELIVKFFMEKRGLSLEDAAKLLLEFRELRQGSRGFIRR